MHMIKQTEIFSKWLLKLKDIKAKVAILRRIQRVQEGDFGDHKSVSSEIREDILKAKKIAKELKDD